MEELIADYESGSLHPGDVKPALAKAINQILQVIISLFLVLQLYLGALVLDPCKVHLYRDRCDKFSYKEY